MPQVIMRRLKSTHNNLRTDEVRGYAPNLPRVGDRFYLFGDPLDPTKDYREISTSPVVSIEGAIFTTRNSTYEIEVLPGA